eukprot:gene5133-5781_t
MDLIPLSYSTLQNIPEESYMLIDIRPRVEYNLKHIISSVNIHCSPLLIRRIEKGSKSIDSLLLSDEIKRKLQRNPSLIFVLYDKDSTHGCVSKDVKQMGSILRKLRKNKALFYLEGGMKTFSKEYHEYCESTPLYVPTDSICQDKIRDPTDQVLFSPLEQEPVLLLPHLFIGSEQHAGNKEVLQRLGITAILNVSKNCRNNFEDEFTYKNIPVNDEFSEDISKYFTETSTFIEQTKDQNGKVLVHCRAGVSRSATICLAYLISRYKFTLDDAYEFIKTKKSLISPNFGFLGQLLSLESQTNVQCENRTEASGERTPFVVSTTAKRIVIQQSPLSPLVPLSADNSSAGSLAFAYPPLPNLANSGSCSPVLFNNGSGTGCAGTACSTCLLQTPT